MELRIGYAIPSGESVSVSDYHLAVTGLTRKSGKTTCLEGIVSRLPSTTATLVFRTGKGEIPFSGAHAVAPYFRPRVDWRFVEGVISAHLLEKARYYRSDVVLAVRGAKSLQQVAHNVQERLSKAKNPWTQKVLVELAEYLQEIVPELESVPWTSEVMLRPGPNVMDLVGLKPALQQLIISSTVDRLMEHHESGEVVIVLPEAQNFIPEGRNTPAKMAVERVVREGAKLGVFLLLDSQYLTGLDLGTMRSIGVWLFGRQTLDVELERVSKMVPGKVPWGDIRRLGLGEFLLVEGDTARKVYAQPVWLSDEEAQHVAMGSLPVGNTVSKESIYKEKNVDAKREQELLDRIAALETQIRATGDEKRKSDAEASRLREELDKRPSIIMPPSLPFDLSPSTPESSEAHLASRQPIDPHDVEVDEDRPSVTVRRRLPVVETNTEKMEGRIAILIADGFFDNGPKRQGEIGKEFVARGFGKHFSGGGAGVALAGGLGKMTLWGFFRHEEDGTYTLVKGVKSRVKVTKEE